MEIVLFYFWDKIVTVLVKVKISSFKIKKTQVGDQGSNRIIYKPSSLVSVYKRLSAKASFEAGHDEAAWATLTACDISPLIPQGYRANQIFRDHYFFFFSLSFFFFFRTAGESYGSSQARGRLELQMPSYTTATALCYILDSTYK